MTASDIIEQVRIRLDEQTNARDYISTYMDNTIKACIADALRWVCMYADASLLMSDSATDASPSLKSYKFIIGEGSTIESEGGGELTMTLKEGSVDKCTIAMPYNYLRLIRARSSGWSKGVSEVMKEDSEEYLMMSDMTSTATGTDPKVAEIDSSPQLLELYPCPKSGSEVYLTIAVSPVHDSSVQDFSIPTRVKTSFLYYLCYLVMISYGDIGKANTMLGAAKASLGGGSQTTEAG